MDKSESPITYSCGFCGAPLDQNKNGVDAPEGYNPDDYPHDACRTCQAGNESWERQYVTHEMAMDAEDPSLEGTFY